MQFKSVLQGNMF